MERPNGCVACEQIDMWAGPDQRGRLLKVVPTLIIYVFGFVWNVIFNYATIHFSSFLVIVILIVIKCNDAKYIQK